MELGSKDIKVVAFDADDTLWDCQSWFDQVEHQCGNLLCPWATQEEVSQSLFATERGNMELLGYGTKAFTISLVENAVRVTKGQITGDIVAQLIQLGKGLLRFPTTPLPEVEHTLQRLVDDGRYRLVVFTKGELMDQEQKLARSGLASYFEYMETVSNKGKDEYVTLCDHLDIQPDELLMPSISPTMWCGSWRSRRSFPMSVFRRYHDSLSCSTFFRFVANASSTHKAPVSR